MATLYVVSEECHGDVSYWLTLEEALDEAKKICASGYTSYAYDGTPLEQLYEELEETHYIDGCVDVREESLGQSWLV